MQALTAHATRRVQAISTVAGLILLASGQAEPINLAAGKPVRFAPAPNYRLTMKGDTDTHDLTDGRLSERPDRAMWFESHCVGYSYPGLANMAIDLGSQKNIGDVVIRFQGGSPQPGICTPGWIDLYASATGDTYTRIASYSRWTAGDNERFNVPPNEGKAWIHPFRFADLNVRARYVGISFYGTGVTVCDEWRILEAESPGVTPEDPITPFSVTRPQLYFHKPEVPISAGMSTPTAVGLILPPDWKPVEAILEMQLPPEVTVEAGAVGGVRVDQARIATGDAAADSGTRYRFPVTLETGGKTWGRLYLRSAAKGDSRGAIRLRWILEDTPTPRHTYPFRVIELPRASRPETLLTGLGWWSLGASRTWPEALAVFEHLGFNTVPVFARWLDRDDPAAELAFVEQARQQGFRIVNIDSPFHHMLARHKGSKDLYAQFEDGTVGSRFCPSYRGPLYEAEIERLARETALVGASYLACDIELWNWRGPQDCEACTRCQADFTQANSDDWAEWRLQKGEEIWRDLATAVKQAVRQAHTKQTERPAAVDIGGYDFRPGHNYQHLWPFDRLYPEFIDASQVSTYTPLHPYHLTLIGDRVREDRARLPESDVLPWLTPGDAGTFPGEAFYHAILECFANGARGTYFWSGRVWDAETLAAYARAIAAVAPAETIILRGNLADDVSVTPEIRLRGMRYREDYFLLAANYHGPEAVTATIRLPAAVHARTVIDTDTGQAIAVLRPEERTLRVTLPDGGARPLLVSRQ